MTSSVAAISTNSVGVKTAVSSGHPHSVDEGVYAFRESLLVVSRGLGSVGLPWRWGADPEAIVLEIAPGT